MTLDKKSLMLNKWEYIIPALVALSLIVSCGIVSYKKYFWNDELYSYYLLADQSFTHMLAAFHDKINNTPPLYFLLGWFWVRVFGSTELSLRLFSSVGLCIACVIVWITLRRTYNFWSASIGVLSVFCTSSLILTQNAEARMYGLFLTVCSLGLLQYDSLNRSSKHTWGTLLPNTCVHAAIVNTHLFGLFYSGAIAFSLIVRDRYFHIFRPKVYLSIVLSWLSLTLYIPSFLNQADAGNPRTWVPIPRSKDLVDLLSLSSSSFISIYVLLLLPLVSGLHFILCKNKDTSFSQTTKQKHQNYSIEISLIIFAYAFLAVPVFVWIISRTIKPIFWDRYMIPSALSWSILLAYLSSRIIYTPIFSKEISNKLGIPGFFIATRTVFLLVLTAILLVHPISYARNLSPEQLPGANDSKYGYSDLPIVTQFSHDFIKRLHYSRERNRYFFILDWQAALDSASGLFPPQEYKHMDALKRNYPEVFQNNITSEDFLSKHNRFLVLDYLDYDKECTLERNLKNLHCPRWLEMRIMNNPHYKITPIGDIDNRKLLLIEKDEMIT